MPVNRKLPAASLNTAGSAVAATPARTPPRPAPNFHPGQLVALRSNPTVAFAVIEVVPGEPEYRYRVFHEQQTATYYDRQLQAVPNQAKQRVVLSAPAVRAYLTALQILSPTMGKLYSIHAGRVHFLPYQYRPVLKLIRSDRPRLLIADEVGVGKTIEAGLILKELQARMALRTVPIVCPKALVAERKWQVEMKRFDEHFTELDGPRLRRCLQETEGTSREIAKRRQVLNAAICSDVGFG